MMRTAFFYPLQLVPAGTLNAEIQNQVIFSQESDFELFQIQFISTGNFSIIFGTSTVLFMPSYVRAANILGTAVLPHPFRPSIQFPRGAALVVKVRNDTASANTVDLLFEGQLLG